MSTPRVYIRSGWDRNSAYDSGVGELLSNNNGNHLEEQLNSLRDNLAAVIRLLVEKNLVTIPEIASACGFSTYHVITEPLSEYSFQLKKQGTSRKRDIVDILHTTSTDFDMDSDNRPYSIKIEEKIVDTVTREEMHAKYPDIKHLGNGL